MMRFGRLILPLFGEILKLRISRGVWGLEKVGISMPLKVLVPTQAPLE